MIGVERRTQPRVAWSGLVIVQIGMHRVQCHGLDLSETGMRVSGTWGAYTGQSVTLSFELMGHVVHSFGVVAWANFGEDISSWGIRFTAVHKASRERIGQYVSHQYPATPVEHGQYAHVSQDPTPVENQTWVAYGQDEEFPTGIYEPEPATPSYELTDDTDPGFVPPSTFPPPGVPVMVPVRTGHTVRVDVSDILPPANFEPSSGETSTVQVDLEPPKPLPPEFAPVVMLWGGTVPIDVGPQPASHVPSVGVRGPSLPPGLCPSFTGIGPTGVSTRAATKVWPDAGGQVTDWTPPPPSFVSEAAAPTTPDANPVDIRARHRAVVASALQELSRRSGPPAATPGKAPRKRPSRRLPRADQADSDPEVMALYSEALDRV